MGEELARGLPTLNTERESCFHPRPEILSLIRTAGVAGSWYCVNAPRDIYLRAVLF